MTSAKHAFLSSSAVKEVFKLGGKVSDMVPQSVERHLLDKFGYDKANC